MIINVKVLQGGDISLEVSPEDTVRSLKESIAKILKISVIQQKLVFKGKTLQDVQTVKDLMIQDGSKLHLAVQPLPSQNDGCGSSKFWDSLHMLLRKHYSTEDCVKIMAEMKKEVFQFVDNLNLDEIERIAIQKQDNKKDR